MNPRHFLLLLAICFVWGINFVVAKWSVSGTPELVPGFEGSPPLFFAFLRFALLYAFLAPWLLPLPKKMGPVIGAALMAFVLVAEPPEQFDAWIAQQQQPFDAATVIDTLEKLNTNAEATTDVAALWPEGSDAGDTKSAPRIWADTAGFEAASEELHRDDDIGVDGTVNKKFCTYNSGEIIR
jgi:hypothetical protein